ncbi:MAG: ABC transporter ATP-binding protein [Anaerolineae bacterium]
MSNQVVVSVERLGKRFKVYGNPWDRAREWLTLGASSRHKDFWALRNVSFELKRGGSLAIIGPNGAGKSTLLKILTGALYPTEGDYQIHGRVLSLLELGTGFNPELTGRENIFLSAQLLGFPQAYLEQRLPDIEAFSELAHFLDRPLKFYSSGMRARLGFSLFAFLDCDVLIIDEVLAVGDVFFRQKCYARLEELMKQNTAIILVTHSMAVVRYYCEEAMVLNQGQVVFQGAPSEAIKRYLLIGQKRDLPDLSPSPVVVDDDEEIRSNDGSEGSPTDTELSWPAPEALLDISNITIVGEDWAHCTGVALCDEDGNPCQVFEQGQRAYFYYGFEVSRDIGIPIGSVSISSDRNILVHGKTTLQLGVQNLSCVSSGSQIRFRQSIKLDIIPGDYTFSLSLATIDPIDYQNAEYMTYQNLASRIVRILNLDQVASFSVTFRKGKGLALVHHGLCDLEGDCLVSIDTGRTSRLARTGKG